MIDPVRLTLRSYAGIPLSWTVPRDVATSIIEANPDQWWDVGLPCPTPCDDDCYAPCHELHQTLSPRDHLPTWCRVVASQRGEGQ